MLNLNKQFSKTNFSQANGYLPFCERGSVTFRNILVFLDLVRVVNCLLVFGSVLVAAFIAGFSGKLSAALMAGLSAALIAGGANGINDFFDVSIDKINKPWRPIVSGRLGRREAFICSIALLALGVVVSGLTGNRSLLLIALIASISLFSYNLRLKRTSFWGNLIISLLCGLVFIYGGVSVGKPKATLIPAFLAFLFHLGREIIKDAQDYQADALAGASTAPIRFGVKTTLKTATFVYVVLLISLFFPYLFGAYHWVYLLLVCVGVVPVLCFVLWSMWRDSSPHNLAKISNLLKLDMIIGLLAILGGAKI